jgi:hypothetical protein
VYSDPVGRNTAHGTQKAGSLFSRILLLFAAIAFVARLAGKMHDGRHWRAIVGSVRGQPFNSLSPWLISFSPSS